MVGNSDRHDAWILNHTPADAARAVAVNIYHLWDPDSFQTILNKWVAAGNSLDQLSKDAADIVKNVKQIFG